MDSELQVRAFKAMADPTRLRILELLPAQPVCRDMYNVNELVHEIGGSQPNMSRHLHILKDAGLVRCRKQCASVYYWRVPEAFERIAAALAALGAPALPDFATAPPATVSRSATTDGLP